ncbi:hypothetical protein ACFYY1_25550 [Streptomyces sp. NPDC001890]|uniref:hypothetical protein n=1 Tax=Streptomyces sp. NPDC001890 TaxID=3364620 RepID=UPI0036AE8C79
MPRGGCLVAALEEWLWQSRAVPGIMDAMDTPIDDWITIAAYENLPGRLRPMAAVRA